MNRYRNLLARNPIVAAPLADVTDYPFRRLLRRFTDGLIHTEMVSVNGLANESEKTWRMIDTVATEAEPIGVQILASDELVAARTMAGIVALRPAFIDINMGCPVRKVLKARCGAALLDDPDRAARIVAAVKGETDLPVGVKMRLGLASVTAEKAIDSVAAAGAEAVTLHGRTALQLYRGPADRRTTLEIARRAPIPVIVSGDVMTGADVREILDGGGAGVLIARGLMGRPWFLAEAAVAAGIDRPIETPSRSAVMLDHLGYVLERDGAWGIRRFRRHLVEYVRGLPGAAGLRHRLLGIHDPDELRTVIASIEG